MAEGDRYFYAVETPCTTSINTENSFASGYEIFGKGQVTAAVSGNGERRNIPPGIWFTGKHEHPRWDQWTMTDADHKEPNTKKGRATGAAIAQNFWKDHIGSEPGGEGGIPDKRPFINEDGYHPAGSNAEHVGVCNHLDGGPEGSQGCPVYQNPEATAWMHDEPEQGRLIVKTFPNEAARDAAVTAKVHELTGKDPDWPNIEPPKLPTYTPAKQSKTKRGNKAIKGSTNVLVGGEWREMLFKKAHLEGGHVVTEGNPTLRVGFEQHPGSCVDHLTTDGSPVDTGDDSVLMLPE